MGEGREAGDDLTNQAIDWLVALDHGNADEDAFQAWRSADPRRAAVFAQVAATWRRTGDRRAAALLDQRDAVARSPDENEDEVRPRLISRRAMAAGVAALAVGAGSVFLAWPRRAYAETAVGERRVVALPDGSRAMLNTDSRVAWSFDDGRDLWVERGETALLIRAGDTPFRVHSDPIDARLSPGSFNLRLEGRGGELLVRAGRAAAACRGTLAETVVADHVLTVTAGAAQIERVPPSAIAVATAWQHGEIIFDGMRLDQAIAEFNRYLPDKIVLGNRDLAQTRLGGNFRIAAPGDFLAALYDGFGIGSRHDGDRIVLYRAGATRSSRNRS